MSWPLRLCDCKCRVVLASSVVKAVLVEAVMSGRYVVVLRDAGAGTRCSVSSEVGLCNIHPDDTRRTVLTRAASPSGMASRTNSLPQGLNHHGCSSILLAGLAAASAKSTFGCSGDTRRRSCSHAAPIVSKIDAPSIIDPPTHQSSSNEKCASICSVNWPAISTTKTQHHRWRAEEKRSCTGPARHHQHESQRTNDD